MYSNTAAFKNKPVAAAPPAGAGLIDIVGVDAEVALGFYKLRSAYTGDCIELRRDSDNTTTNIGFDANGEIDTAAITSFCGGGNGTVVKWYDQSGNGLDFATANQFMPGTTSQEPLICYVGGVTRDIAGNVAMYSKTPGSTSSTGDRFLNGPVMPSRQRPTVTILGQVNYFNGNGLIFCDFYNGYNLGTYGSSSPANSLRVIRSQGSNLVTKSQINWSADDSFAATIFYNDEVGDGTTVDSRFWATSYLNNIVSFQTNWYCWGFNASTFSHVTLLRYAATNQYPPSLHQNCAMSSWIYWDLPDGTTLSSQELYDLYDWVETNYGYTNLAPTP